LPQAISGRMEGGNKPDTILPHEIRQALVQHDAGIGIRGPELAAEMLVAMDACLPACEQGSCPIVKPGRDGKIDHISLVRVKHLDHACQERGIVAYIIKKDSLIAGWMRKPKKKKQDQGDIHQAPPKPKQFTMKHFEPRARE